jgi:hypothetical protein
MDREEKIKVAVTAGIVAVILLILIIFLAVSGKKKNNDKDKTFDDVAEYVSLEASDGASSAAEAGSDASNSAATGASGENASEDSSVKGASKDAASAGKTGKAYSEYPATAKGDVSGNSFYATTTPLLKDLYKYVNYNTADQLKEMASYFESGNIDAVRDLAHLERFEAMSYSLKGTSDFYYYGDVNDKGLPNGKGIAVYASSQYYYGDWADGKRNGKGEWFTFYPNYSTYVVTEHMYSGDWKDDLPDGEGQEHYDYAPEYMNNSDVYLQNAIGGFSKGLYNGDMYIMNIDKTQSSDEWLGKCSNGVFARIDGAANDKKGNIPVLKMRQHEKILFYMAEKKNKNNGVSGIISGGSVKK